MALNAATSVDNKHPLYDDRVHQICTLVNDCVAGEIAMKKRLQWPGVDPKTNSAEDNHRMAQYVRNAAYVNATRRTLNSWTGIVFATPVAVNIGQAKISTLANNADGNGQPIAQMVRDALTEVLKSGRAALVPIYDSGLTFDENGDPQLVTANDAQNAKMRIRLFYNEEIINWRTIDRQDRLVVFKYKETVDDPETFDNFELTVWHEFRMIEGKAYQRRWWSVDGTVPNSGVTPDVSGKQGVTALTAIMINGQAATSLPISWIGSINNDSYPDDAPLYDIASLNEKHYQIEADLAELTHLVAQPTVVITGAGVKDRDNLSRFGIKLGSSTAIPLSEKAKIDMLQAEERNGVIALAERREKQMATIGAQMIDESAVQKTATEADYDAQSDTSSLSLVASNTEAAFNHVLGIMASLAGTTVAGDAAMIGLNKQYTSSSVDGQMLTAMFQVVQGGKMTVEDFVRWLVKNGVIELGERTIDQVVDEVNNATPTLSTDNITAALKGVTGNANSNGNNTGNEDDE